MHGVRTIPSSRTERAFPLPPVPVAMRRAMACFARVLATLASFATSSALAQTSEFAFQGRLTDSGRPASGVYDFRFALHASATEDRRIGDALELGDVPVALGNFAVRLDFGAAVFDGSPRWIEIEVRAGDSTGSYARLDPRPLIASTPYALRAAVASALDDGAGISAENPNNRFRGRFAGVFVGDGAGLTNLPALAGPAGPAGPVGLTGPQGPVGPQGPQGAPGVRGPAGEVGAAGPAGPAGPVGQAGVPGTPGARGLNFRGPWTAETAYAIDDAVARDGSAWLARRATTGSVPTEGADWTLLVARGEPGPTGPVGPTGATGPQGFPGPQGFAGPSGERGPAGEAGPAGAVGPAGPAGPAGVPGTPGARGLNFRGPWTAETAYAIDDAVVRDGSAWLARRATTGSVPTEGTDWTLLVARGEPGPTGPVGPTGATGPQGLPGPQGLAGPSGERGPAGEVGPAGPVGPMGPRGLTFRGAWTAETAYAIDDAVVHGFSTWLARQPTTGVEPFVGQDWTLLVSRGDAGEVGPPGPAGPTGERGPAGLDGPAGPMGPAGPPGPPGPPASTETLESLVRTLAAQIEVLRADLVAVSNRQDSGVVPASVFASSDPEDAELTGKGLEAFTLINNRPWSNGTTVGVPAGRNFHTAIWTGRDMLVWGGTAGTVDEDLGGAAYDPALDAWFAVPRESEPSPRWAHSAVWTGSQMLVWGGFAPHGAGYRGDGARFSYGEWAWKSMSTTDAPSPRGAHGAVWTGSLMIVFGGTSVSGFAEGGGAYDPALDRWSSLPTVDAPSPREEPRMVWTGDRVLIWGGSGIGEVLGTGAQLLFEGGVPVRWAPMSLVGAPAPRFGHSAVWTGSRLLVWGGSGNGEHLNDGASYDPATDTWAPIASSGALIERAQHTSVWTGSELVVFGGETQGFFNITATGGAYDPVQNRWRNLDNGGSPRARTRASAVWTGTEMLVFGGHNNATPLADLQRLVPQPTRHLFRKP